MSTKTLTRDERKLELETLMTTDSGAEEFRRLLSSCFINGTKPPTDRLPINAILDHEYGDGDIRLPNR